MYAVGEAERSTTPLLRAIDGDPGDPIRITALFYAETLADLALPSGMLRAPLAGEPSRAIPTTHRAIRETIVGESAGSWRDLSAPDPRITAFRFFGETPCRKYTAQLFELARERYMAGLFAESATAAIAVVYSGDFGSPIFYRVTLSGAERLATEIPNFSARTGVRTYDRRLFLGGIDTISFQPAAYLGTVERGFERLPAPPTIGAIRAAAAPRRLEGGEDASTVYALSDFGTIARYRGGAWSSLGMIDGLGNSGPLIAWAAPDELFLVAPDQRDVYHFRQGNLRREATPIAEDLNAEIDSLTALSVSDDLGAALGSRSGFLMLRQDARWSIEVPPLVQGHRLYSIVPFNGGLLFGGDIGSLEQYYPGRGRCDDEVLYIGSNVLTVGIVPVDGGLKRGLILAGVRTEAQEMLHIFVAAATEQ